MDKRCDQTTHCQDKSDENNCKLVIMENYNKNLAPFTVNQSNDEIDAVNVNIDAKVINILKINEVEQLFQVKISLMLTWFDYRLTYHNLKVSRMANSPTLAAVKKFWIPRIIFDNTEHNDVMTLDNLAKVTISKEGTSAPSDETNVDEIEIFKGSENKINLDKGFTKTVECIYQLQLYPFDTQECTVNLQVGEYETKMIKLVPKSIQMKSQTILTQFVITDWKLEYKNRGNILQFSSYIYDNYSDEIEAGVHIKIILKRRINNAILTIYLPTILILIIVYATNFFKDFFFEAVVSVNLTTMLVITTMFISTSTSLPTTSYIKMIEVWLLFNLFLPFLIVLLHTYMDTLREDEDREVNHHGQAIEVATDVPTQEKELPFNKDDEKKRGNSWVKGNDLISPNEKLQQVAIRYAGFYSFT